MRSSDDILDVVASDRPWAVVEGDAMEALRAIPDGAANAVITDPPYGIGYRDTKGENILNDDGPYIWFLRDAWRILAPSGSLICFCRWDVQHAFRQAIEWSGLVIKSQIVWDKGTPGMGDTATTFAPGHEVAWFAAKRDFRFPRGRPTSVVKISVRRDKRVHPTQKPEDLMRALIDPVTRRNDLVVDPFCGSGSTGVAAVSLGRRFIGIELDSKHAATSIRRIQNVDCHDGLYRDVDE